MKFKVKEEKYGTIAIRQEMCDCTQVNFSEFQLEGSIRLCKEYTQTPHEKGVKAVDKICEEDLPKTRKKKKEKIRYREAKQNGWCCFAHKPQRQHKGSQCI